MLGRSGRQRGHCVAESPRGGIVEVLEGLGGRARRRGRAHARRPAPAGFRDCARRRAGTSRRPRRSHSSPCRRPAAGRVRSTLSSTRSTSGRETQFRSITSHSIPAARARCSAARSDSSTITDVATTVRAEPGRASRDPKSGAGVPPDSTRKAKSKRSRCSSDTTGPGHRPRIAGYWSRTACAVDGISTGQPGDVGEHRLEALRVLGALPPAPPDDQADQERHLESPAVHVPVLGGDVHDLVHGQEREVDADVSLDGYRPLSAAPTAIPVSPSSATGTSITRSRPNSAASPSVEPKVPLWSSTPCPSR